MKVLDWIIALCGLWEPGDIVLPFVIGSGNVQAFVWNHIIVGMLLVLAAAGVWLMIAPFLLGTPEIAAGLWNDLIVGGIVLVVGAWSALASPRATR